jgi:hypothetical protein
MKRRACTLIALGVLLGARCGTAAAADKQSLTLGYVAPTDLDCPDASSFENLVAARLGYDPFVATSPDSVRVEITKDKGRLRGRATIQRAGAREQPPARELVGELTKCEALGAALATSLAIALDPVRALAPPPANPPPANPPPANPPPTNPPPANPPPANPPPTNSPPVNPPPANPPRTTALDVGAAFLVSVGEAPSVALGASVGAAFRWKSFVLEALARVTSTAGAVTLDSGDRASALVFGGEIAPCLRLSFVTGCTFLRAAGFRGFAPDVVDPAAVVTAAAFTGVRLGVGIPLGSVITLRPTIEGAIALVRTSFLIDRATVWTAPPVALTFGLGVTFTVL